MRRKHRRGYQGRFTRLASRYRSLFTLVWTFLAFLSVPGFNGSAHAQSATYRVTFEGKFTASALASGVSVPSGEHFTTLIGAVHNGGATFWSSGAMASAGVEAVAELGNTATFESEIKANMNAVAVIEKSLPSGGTPTATVDFTVTTAHPRVTLLTMIAPSPDWFVGVSGLSLLDAQGDWLASHSADLFPYDAGTEEGTEFSLSNAATSPQGTITSIQGTGKFSNEPIVTLTFTRQAVAPEITSATTFPVHEATTAVATLTAEDQDTAETDLTWSIPTAGGADAGQFTLSADGDLAFAAAPDYENPDDADGDNVYEVTVQVSDGDNTDTADNPAELDHEALAADSSHKVDGVKPELAVTDGAVVDGAPLTLTYNETLDGTSMPAASAFTVAGGSQSRTVSGVRVRGSTVEISSDPGSDRIYAPEDEIQATVTFSEPVEVERTPRLMLKVGDRDRPAGYLEGTGTTELVFGYEVVDGDEDTDGVSIEANRLSLNADPVLWYAMPAASWNEALPVGNGRLAGMVFGNTGRERIQLNEDTLWAGAPHQRDILGAHRHLPEIRRLLFAGRYVEAQEMVNRELFIGGRVVRAYQTLGDLWIDLGTESQAGYRRELDLETGIARTEWTRDGVAFTREVFASAPHGVLVVRIEADTPGAITGTVELTRPVDATTTAAGTELVLEGRASHGGQQLGVRFQARLRAVAEGGSAVAEGASLRLSGADAVTLILAAATDYRGTAPGPDAVRQVEAAEATGYTALREAHVADHRAIFNRVWLELGGSEWRREPTDTRLRFVRSGGEDTDLEAMYFQFGRYLLMASSRPGTMPANLQGVWNEAVEPPWNSDYHININIQMIYWPADVANLSEMQEPLWDMLDRLRERGRATARDHYGFERGFVAHHTTDAWWWTSPVGSARYGMWPSGGAWLSRHMWEAYLFNRDAAFLRERAYPVLKEAAEFFLDWLVPEPGTDLLLSGPSISPENAFRINGRRTHVTMGPAMDQQIVRDLFENVLAAAAELGIDDAFTQETAAKLTKLAGPQVGTDGRLMEWRQEELVEADPGHRHISHAFGLYPGSQFTVRGTPDLAAAVRKSIEHRVANGGGGTGWSLGWLLNMWARLEAGGKAYSTLRRLLTDMTMDNLLDLHPLLAGARTNVFQMDGNLGGTAGIAEMLLQSHAGEIHLLPALPRQWSRGVVEGLKARGGFEVSMAWSDGALTTVSIRSRSGEECRVRVAGGEVRTLAVGMGETRWFDGQLSEVRAPQGLGAPRDVAVTGSTPTSLSVTWQPPLFEGRSVYGYDVQYAKRGESGFREWPHRGRAPGTTITGLERDAAWKVRVRARNASGPGAWSSAVEYTGDIVAPVIDTIEITSNPGPDATYAAGDTIEVTVTFDETVKVEGTPRLTLRVGIRNRTAGYLRVTDTAALVFGYEVVLGDEDTDGVSIAAGRIDLNGGTIKDEADNDAVLDHEAVAPQAGHKVDGVRPAFLSAAVDGSSLTLTYGEALDESSTPATDAFTVTVAGSGRTVTGVSVSGRAVTLTLASAVTDGQEVTVTYTVPGTNPLRDAAGNAAEGLSNDPVWNATPDATPPTISIVLSPGHGVPLNMAITATVTLDNLDPARYSSLVFRADLTEWEQAFARSTHCGGKDTGKDITVEVDASRETITVEVWKSCSQDIYAYFTLDAALFRLDTSAPGGRVELASAETRFAMSRYLQAGQTAPPPPAPGVAAWLDPDPTSFEWKVGESVVFRGRTDILQYLNHHLGVRGFGPEDGARFADDTDGLDAEEACRNVDDGIVDWRRAIHQPVRFFACRAGEAIIEVWHETEAERLSTYEFRVRPADDDEVAAPVITTTSPILVPENETAVATLNATDDTPSDQLTWTIPSGTNGGADADRFALSDAGALSFKAAKDYEIPDDADGDRTYEVTVQVSDGDNSVAADLLVTLENVLELTPLTGPAMVDYPENKALRVAAYIASSEEDREGLDWILSGADANRFSIGNPGGVLRFDIDPIAPDVFLQLPDFEDPADSNTDNVYSVTLAASDGTDTVTLDVSVTVGDENEAGTLSLDSPRPRFGEALTASVSDPDGDVSAITWKWERSAGRNAWVVIDGTTAASYTPTAADTGAYLRVTADYTDRRSIGQEVRAVAPNVVLAHALSRLEVTTSSSRSMYPSFEPEILHYAVGCPDGDTMTLTLSTDETDTRLAVNGIQRANRNVAVELTGLAGGSDIPITLTGSEGASTTYVLHCLADDFPAIITEKKPGAWDGLITIGVRAPVGSYLAIIDNNGVPRIHWRIEERVRIFRTHRDGRYPYSYGQAYSRNVIVLDENMEPVDKVTTVRPIHDTDLHDFVVKSNGNYLLLAYESARRDMSQFINSDNGEPYSTTELTRDSVIQEVTPDKEEAFNWNSWDHMAVEDCTQHRFPDDYAHVNSVQAFDDDIVASFRGCSKVLRIDGVSGDVIWRLGKSNRSDADWAASGNQPPLRIVGDPYGEFCGQHSARMIDNGNLLLFDNGVACLVDPEGNRTRPGEDFTRIVEYAIDPDHGEAVFRRHYSYHGEFNKLAQSQGHIEPLETGNWLISWGSMPVSEKVTEFNPLTGEEVLIIKLHELGDSDSGLRTTAYPVSSVALAKKVAPLTAEIVESPASSVFHLGPTDAPKVVVAFNQPVVDPDPAATTWPWVSVQGATVTSVSAHTVPGDPANAYLFTLTPAGVGPITFAPVAGQSCASGGICTAAGTVLSVVPATAHTIAWVDTVAPALAATDAATVRGATLTLTFDEALASANTAASAFAVTGGTTRTISGVSVNGSTVQLTIDPPVLYGESGIEVDYTAPSREALADASGNEVASFEDRAVSNETPATTLSTEVSLSLDTASVSEGGSAKSVALTAMLNRSARPAATAVTVEVGTTGDTATEGTDYAAVDDLTLTIPAYMTGITVRFTLTPTNDRIDELGESLTVTGSTAVAGLIVTPPGGLALDIEDNDPAPSLALSVNASAIDEDGGTAAVTVSTGSGSTFATDQTVRLAVAGTATENADYTIGGKALTLPAGTGTSASMVTATVTGLDDNLDDDDETIEITGSRNGVAFGSRQTIAIEDDDWPVLTVTFRAADYRVAEGEHVDLPVTLSAVPERQVTIPIEIEVAGGAEAVDYSVSPASLTFGASETDKTVRVSAANDSAVDLGESVALRFGTPLPERISEGGIAETTVAIRDTDFTFAPAFAAGSGTTESDADVYTVSEDSSALRLSLTLGTPRGARVADVADPVVVTLATRENAGGREADEDYATRRRSGTFGDYGELNLDLSFAPGDFSDDGNCGCATAEKSVSVDLFDDRVHERVEVFGLRLARKSGRLSLSSKDVTIRIIEDDAEPVLDLEADPARIAEAGGASTVTVSTGNGSTFPAAQTIRLELGGTATRGADYTIDSTALTLPAGMGEDPSTVSTTVRALDDPIDDDGETVALSATRDGVEFASRAVAIADDDIGSTRVDLAVNPAQVREDAGATTVRVTATLDGAAREEDTDVAVTVGASGDAAVEGTDYATVPDLTLTIDAGETTAETRFSLDPTNNDSVEGAKTITVDGSVSGLAVRSTDLTLNDDDVESTTVALTLDPLEVRENAGSRAVRVTGTLDGGSRPTATVVAVTVGSGGDSAAEGTDYQDVGDLELTIPANRTDGTVTFTLRPANDRTAEGTETMSVRGDVAGLTVTPAELAIADDDTASTRLDLSLSPSTVSEAAAPTEVAVTGSLNAGARTSDSFVTVTVGALTDTATEGLDYAYVSALAITIPANETAGQTTFTLSPDNDAIAEGAETISVTGRAGGLTVEPTALTLSDNDTASRIVTLAADPESVSEDTPADVTVTASLDAGARAEDTQVRLTVGAAGDTAVPGTDYEPVSERTLTILSGETGGTATFPLEPLDNDSADGARTLSVTGSTTVAELRIEPASGTKIALADDDSPAVLVTPDRLTVVEAESGTYMVELQTRPTADVTVTITGVSGDLSLDRTSLVFTQAEDWSDPQNVTVTAADDDDSAQDAAVTLTHRASGAPEYRGLRAELAVSIRENDPSLVFSETALAVPEGETATYTVALATVPTADVTVRITGASGDLSLDKTELARLGRRANDHCRGGAGRRHLDGPGGDADAPGVRRGIRRRQRNRARDHPRGRRRRRRRGWRRQRRRRRRRRRIQQPAAGGHGGDDSADTGAGRYGGAGRLRALPGPGSAAHDVRGGVGGQRGGDRRGGRKRGDRACGGPRYHRRDGDGGGRPAGAGGAELRGDRRAAGLVRERRGGGGRGRHGDPDGRDQPAARCGDRARLCRRPGRRPGDRRRGCRRSRRHGGDGRDRRRGDGGDDRHRRARRRRHRAAAGDLRGDAAAIGRAGAGFRAGSGRRPRENRRGSLRPDAAGARRLAPLAAVRAGVGERPGGSSDAGPVERRAGRIATRRLFRTPQPARARYVRQLPGFPAGRRVRGSL